MVRARLKVLVAAAGAVVGLLVPASAQAAKFEVGFQSDNVFLYGAGMGPDRALAAMDTVGGQVLRINISWRLNTLACSGVKPKQLENPNHRCYDWSLTDYVVDRARARNMNIIATVAQIPAWANGGRDQYNVGKTEAQFKNTVLHMRAFAIAAGKRYKVGPRQIRYWTILNEPNSSYFFKPFNSNAPRRYAFLYTTVAKALKGVNRSAKVAPGPTGPQSTMPPVTYIKKIQPHLKKYGARPYIDAWAHNPYASNRAAPRKSRFKTPRVGINNLPSLFKALDGGHATRGKKVWATEFAYETRPEDNRTGVSKENQATYMGDAFDMMWTTKRVPIVIWYVFQDPVPKLDWQSGIFKSNGVKKPSYHMFARPIARAKAVTKKGTRVRIWGKSNANPGTTQLVWSSNGRAWKKIPGQRRVGSVAVASPRFKRAMFVAVRDSGGLGPKRKVRVS